MNKFPMAITEKLKTLFFTQRTLDHQDVLLLYREPGILTGYRPPGKSFLYYIASIFQLHNETVNIWTHSLACCIFLYKLYNIIYTSDFETDCETFPLIGFSVCIIISTFLSAFTHTFLSKSPMCHYMCLLMDYAGVGIYGLGKCILFFHISSPPDVFQKMERIYLPYNIFLSWIVMCGCSIAKLFYRRPYPFQRKFFQLGAGGLHALLGGIPMTLRFLYCFIDDICEISSLNHHVIWMLTMIVSLFFFSSHLPDKKFPGSFDYFGQGHSIFHVIISYTMLLQYQAAYIDIAQSDGSRWKCHPVTGTSIFATILIYCIGSVVIMFILKKYVTKRIESDVKQQH